jgi:hypothetical protein
MSAALSLRVTASACALGMRAGCGGGGAT